LKPFRTVEAVGFSFICAFFALASAGFATYSSRTEVDGRMLVYRREYRLREPDLPASRYKEVLAFYLGVAADEQQSLLLRSPESWRP